MITQVELKRLMVYEPSTGNLRWIIKPNKSVKVGDIAGAIKPSGVARVIIHKKSYRLSDLVWLWNFGKFPDSKLVHLSKEGFSCTKVEYLMPLNEILSKPITQQLLKATYYYNEKFGEFSRINNFSGTQKGAVTTATNYQGYGVISVYKRKYPTHRLAWLYVYGELPSSDLDHIDHNKMNNRISNLRLVTKRENSLNQKKHSTNTSGVTGVSKGPLGNWRARITVKGTTLNLGTFSTKQEATAAREAANIKYNFHKNHGRNL